MIAWKQAAILAAILLAIMDVSTKELDVPEQQGAPEGTSDRRPRFQPGKPHYRVSQPLNVAFDEPSFARGDMAKLERLASGNNENELVGQFRKMGRLARYTNLGYLYFTIDLLSYDEYLKVFERELKNVTNDHHMNEIWWPVNQKPELAATAALVNSTLTLWGERVSELRSSYLDMMTAFKMEEALQGPLSVKVKRAIATLVIGIVGGISALVGWISLFISGRNAQALSEFDKEGRTPQVKYLVSNVQDHRDQLVNLTNHVNKITKQMNEIQLNHRLRNSDKMEVANYLGIQLNHLEVRLNSLTIGVEALVSGHLSTRLIPAPVLRNALLELKGKVQVDGYELPQEHPSMLQGMRVAYHRGKNGILKILVPIPLIKTRKVMTLWSFHSLPVKLPQSTHSISVQAHEEIIAVTTKQDQYRLFSPRELAACTRIGDLHFCPRQNVLRSRFSDYCLSALFKGKSEAAHHACVTSVHPNRTEQLQITGNVFLLFHPTMQRLQYQCRGLGQEQETFEGSRKLYLPGKCTAKSDHYQLEGETTYGAKGENIDQRMHWSSAALLQSYDVSMLESVLPLPPPNPIAMKDIVNEYKAKKLASWTMPIGLGLFGDFVMPIIYALIAIAIFLLFARPIVHSCLSHSGHLRHFDERFAHFRSREPSISWYDANFLQPRKDANGPSTRLPTRKLSSLARLKRRSQGRESKLTTEENISESDSTDSCQKEQKARVDRWLRGPLPSYVFGTKQRSKPSLHSYESVHVPEEKLDADKKSQDSDYATLSPPPPPFKMKSFSDDGTLDERRCIPTPPAPPPYSSSEGRAKHRRGESISFNSQLSGSQPRHQRHS